MRRTGIGLAFALLLAGGCGGPSSVGPKPHPSRSPPAHTSHSPDRLEAALPSADDLPTGYEIQVSCRAPEDPTCETDGAPGVYNVLTATAPPGSDNWGLADSVYVVTASFKTAEEAAEVVTEFHQTTKGDFTGTIDLDARTDGETGTVPGERGTGSMKAFSAGDWHGTLATKSTRLVAATGDPSPRGVYATIVASSGRTVLTFAAVRWTGRRDVATATEEVGALFDAYLDRLAS